jgi:hypothetical protein
MATTVPAIRLSWAAGRLPPGYSTLFRYVGEKQQVNPTASQQVRGENFTLTIDVP